MHTRWNVCRGTRISFCYELFILVFVVTTVVVNVVFIIVCCRCCCWWCCRHCYRCYFICNTNCIFLIFQKHVWLNVIVWIFILNDKIVDTSVPLPISVRTPLPRRQSQAHRDLCINRNFSLCICWKSLSLVWFEYFPFLLQAAAVPCLCGCHAGVRPTSCVRHISGSCLDNWHPRPVLEILPRRKSVHMLCNDGGVGQDGSSAAIPCTVNVFYLLSLYSFYRIFADFAEIVLLCVYWECSLFTAFVIYLQRCTYGEPTLNIYRYCFALYCTYWGWTVFTESALCLLRLYCSYWDYPILL